MFIIRPQRILIIGFIQTLIKLNTPVRFVFKTLSQSSSFMRKNKLSEVIPALLKMIPEFDDVDLEGESISKIASILEAIAAAKGIELNLPDKNTWARYLGRK